jgi:hypothetical protein
VHLAGEVLSLDADAPRPGHYRRAAVRDGQQTPHNPKGKAMADLDLGVATEWDEGDTHGRVKLTGNRVYPDTDKKDVVVSGPNSVEIAVNTNNASSQEAAKIYFTTRHGSSEKIIGILDSDGNLYIAGNVITGQKNLGA